MKQFLNKWIIITPIQVVGETQTIVGVLKSIEDRWIILEAPHANLIVRIDHIGSIMCPTDQDSFTVEAMAFRSGMKS